MAFEYLKTLVLTPEQEEKLRALGARTPVALLSRIDASPEKFAQFFGAEDTARIRDILEKMVSPEEKAQLAELPAFRGKFGALVAGKDRPETAQQASERRDQLMARIRMIRESGVSSEKTKELLEDLEREFREEVRASVSGGD